MFDKLNLCSRKKVSEGRKGTCTATGGYNVGQGEWESAYFELLH